MSSLFFSTENKWEYIYYYNVTMLNDFNSEVLRKQYLEEQLLNHQLFWSIVILWMKNGLNTNVLFKIEKKSN